MEETTPEKCDCISKNKSLLNRKETAKQHIQVRIGTLTAIEKYICAAGLLDEKTQNICGWVIMDCNRRTSFSPSPHTKAVPRSSSIDPQAHITIDVVHSERRNYIHAVDESTTWSEATTLSERVWSYRYQKYDEIIISDTARWRLISAIENTRYTSICYKTWPEMVVVTANDHETDCLIITAYHTLRLLFNRLKMCDRRNTTDALTGKALFGKIVSIRLRRSSTLELRSGRHPPLLKTVEVGLYHQYPENNIRNKSRAIVRAICYVFRYKNGWTSCTR